MSAVECTGEDRGHEPIRPRKGCDRFKGAARALQVRSAGIAGQYVQLEQRARRYRVFDQGLDRLVPPANRIGPELVQEAAEDRDAVSGAQLSLNIALSEYTPLA